MASIETVRIGATVEEPFVYNCFIDYPARCPYFGTDLEFIYDILVNLFSLNVVWKEYEDFNELYEALDNNEIDLIGNTLGVDMHFYRNTSLWLKTDTVMQLGLAFFVKSANVPMTINPLKIIKWDLWMCIVAASGFVYLLDKLVPKFKHKFAFITSKFFHFLWFFILLLLMEFYGNIFTADLITTTKTPELFTTLNELGEKLVLKECNFVIFDKYVEYEEFDIIFQPHLNFSWAANFRTAFKTNPPIQVKSKDDMLVFVRNNTCTIGIDIIGPDTSLYSPLCDIDVKVFTEEIPFRPYVYYHTITSLEHFFNFIRKSTGFSEISNDLLKRYFKRQIKSFYLGCNMANSDSYYVLTLQKMSFCFSILIIGISISGFISFVQFIRQTYMLNRFVPSMRRKQVYSLKHHNF